MPKVTAAVLALAAGTLLNVNPVDVGRATQQGAAAGANVLALDDTYSLRLSVSDLQRQIGLLQRELDTLRYRYANHRHYLEGDAVTVEALFANRGRYRNYSVVLTPGGRPQTTAPLQ